MLETFGTAAAAEAVGFSLWGEELKVPTLTRRLAPDILVHVSIGNNLWRSRQTAEGSQSVCTSTGKSRDRCSAPRTGSLCVV